jgi:hypothetical protein
MTNLSAVLAKMNELLDCEEENLRSCPLDLPYAFREAMGLLEKVSEYHQCSEVRELLQSHGIGERVQPDITFIPDQSTAEY